MSENFDGCLEAYDWRYSAAILGLQRYLEYHKLPSNWEDIRTAETDSVENDVFRYHKSDITEERYLQFAEYFYGEDFPHVKALQKLKEEDYTDEKIKEINEQLTYNVVMKKFFAKEKFDGTNRERIEAVLKDNWMEIVRETFRNKTNMYRNYCNTNQLFHERQEVCRLNGYYVDWAKKGKSASYAFDTGLFAGNDIPEFDFIPFAFTEHMDGIFINYSSSIHDLVNANNALRRAMQEKEQETKEEGKSFSIRQVLLEKMIHTADFLNYDVELIKKQRDKEYFETIYLREKSIGIFKSLKSSKAFLFSYKVTDAYYINVLERVMNAIINLTVLDETIEFFLKEGEKDKPFTAIVMNLIKVNHMIYQRIYGGEKMNRKAIQECAGKIAKKLEENKLATYRTKLTSAVVFKDYNRVCEILLQLSNFANVSIECMLDVLQNCEERINGVYLFIACLRKQSKSADENKGGVQE